MLTPAQWFPHHLPETAQAQGREASNLASHAAPETSQNIPPARLHGPARTPA